MGHFKDLILSFKKFQSLAPLKAKGRCPVDRRHKGISKAPDDRVCLLWIWERNLNISARYSGTNLLIHLCIIVASFRISFSLIGSHSSDRSLSEICSYLLKPKMIRPAKFWTFCNLSILLLLVLLQTVEQY